MVESGTQTELAPPPPLIPNYMIDLSQDSEAILEDIPLTEPVPAKLGYCASLDVNLTLKERLKLRIAP